MSPLMPASVAWYVTGRFYLSTDGKTVQDLGYFLHLEGLAGALFKDPKSMSEATARLTFRAVPFTSGTVQNGDLSLSVDPVGDFNLYLKDEKHAGASFEQPDTFSDGSLIATFRRASVVVGGTFSGSGRALALNVFTARLVWSTEFELDGQRYDLRRLLPHGITQWGEAGPTAVTPAPKGFSSVVPFVGSAVAVGPPPGR
ncbi:hypothetical protein [Pyxidicoccus xibeiensis]|uniref:hypothetical protein n=1 Tax=Pyxidicoccus xibeiensis TaxID=2906759 RepID=UPI0020A7E8C4|nr:hypothetical protein [Pyxidicoccus xibeiensis]MCP3142540.1 hypothetical protein [Pyxidicoccus xibeiensis]